MQLVQRVADDGERRRAESLATSERRVAQCEAKLAELESYQANYASEFGKRASLGIGAAGLREYQAFLGRLAEAVRQQGELLARARQERDAQRLQWQSAAQRADIIGKVVERDRSLEQRRLEAQEQRDTDERAQNGIRRIDASGTQ
jgi:flagellar FliJ protein